MNAYVLARDGNVIRTGLPTTGRLADGRAVSGYDRLPHDVLIAEGWLPLIDEPPAHDPDTQHAVQDGYDIGTDQVTVRYRLEPLPPSLTADEYQLTADGVDTVTVTYRHPNPDTRPAQVTFDVNGATKVVAITSAGTAHLDIAADTPGGIVVSCEGLTLELEAI